MSAWLMRSELTTAPIVVRLRCSAIGPSSLLERRWRPRRACPRSGSWCCRSGPRATPRARRPTRRRAGRGRWAGRRGGLALGDGTGAGRPTALGAAADAPATRSARRWPRRRRHALAPGEPLGAPAGAGDGLASGPLRGRVSCSVLISMNPARLDDRARLEALLGEDLLDLVGRDVRVLEADLPAGAAGVVDRELQARVR